jgi:hypothetical protein
VPVPARADTMLTPGAAPRSVDGAIGAVRRLSGRPL